MQERKAEKNPIIKCINYKQLQADPESEPLKTFLLCDVPRQFCFQMNPEASNLC